jgi:hypothetical protein
VSDHFAERPHIVSRPKGVVLLGHLFGGGNYVVGHRLPHPFHGSDAESWVRAHGLLRVNGCGEYERDNQ